MTTATSTRTSRNTRRVFAAAAALLVAAVGFTPAASAEAVPVTYTELGPGYTGVYNAEPAGSIVFNIGGKSVKAYCADVTKPFNTTAAFTLKSADSSGIPGIASAGWIVANAGTVPSPLADQASEDAAIQVAVWSFTNGIVIDSTTVASASIRGRAQALVAAAGSNTVASAPTTFALTMSGALSGSAARFTASLATDAGTPIAGRTINFTAGAASGSAVTAADGTAVWETPAAAANASVTAKATFSGQVTAGTVIVADDASQPVVLAENVDVTRTASASVTTTAAPVTTTTAAPPTTTPPTTVKPTTPTTTPAASSAVAEELPYTGASVGLPHLIAGLVVLAGAALYFRRRQLAA